MDEIALGLEYSEIGLEYSDRLILGSLINRLRSISSVQGVELEGQKGMQWSYGILVYAQGQEMRRFAITETNLRSSTFSATIEAIIASVPGRDRT